MSLSEPFNTIDPRTGETFAEYATRVGMKWESIQKGIDYIERRKQRHGGYDGQGRSYHRKRLKPLPEPR